MIAIKGGVLVGCDPAAGVSKAPKRCARKRSTRCLRRAKARRRPPRDHHVVHDALVSRSRRSACGAE